MFRRETGLDVRRMDAKFWAPGVSLVDEIAVQDTLRGGDAAFGVMDIPGGSTINLEGRFAHAELYQRGLTDDEALNVVNRLAIRYGLD